MEGGRDRNRRRPRGELGCWWKVEETGTAGDQEAELRCWWKVEETGTAGFQEVNWDISGRWKKQEPQTTKRRTGMLVEGGRNRNGMEAGRDRNGNICGQSSSSVSRPELSPSCMLR